MSEWKSLSSITSKIGSGSTPRGGNSVYSDSGISFIRSQNVLDMDFSTENLAFINDDQAEKLNNVIVEKNDILLNITGDSIARCTVVPEEILPARVNQHVSIIRCKNTEESKYVMYYLQYMKKYLLQISKVGGTRNALTKEAIGKLPIKISDDCNKISKILDNIDQKIQTNNQINQELEAMAKTLYDYWFVQFDFPDQNGKPYKSSGGQMVYHQELKREIPVGWGVEKLKDKLSVSRGISYKTENIKDNIGTPMINLASIDINRNYKSTGLKYFNGDYLKEKIVSGGDLLIACTDLTRNADIVGSPIIVPFDEQNYVFSMDLAKIDSKVDYINKYYLYSTLRTEHYHNYIKNWASGTNVLHLNIDGINWYSISIPPVELQEEYSKIILNFSKKTNKNIQENQQLTQLRDWLLPMLMNGQVKVE